MRTMEIYVDDELITTWSSSGTTTDLEGIDFDAVGETVELRGVLADSEWLSILEVGTNINSRHPIATGYARTI